MLTNLHEKSHKIFLKDKIIKDVVQEVLEEIPQKHLTEIRSSFLQSFQCTDTIFQIEYFVIHRVFHESLVFFLNKKELTNLQ